MKGRKGWKGGMGSKGRKGGMGRMGTLGFLCLISYVGSGFLTAGALAKAVNRTDTEQTRPEMQRVPLVLFHFEDASYEEIARALRISLAKVKTDIHRGREALRKLLETENPANRLRQGSGGQEAGLYRDRDGSR